MSKYREGQKVFAYIVMQAEGPNILTNGKSPLGQVLIEKTGRGPSHTYEWFNADRDELTYWHCAKAGRGFIKGDGVDWDEDTQRKIEQLKAEVQK